MNEKINEALIDVNTIMKKTKLISSSIFIIAKNYDCAPKDLMKEIERRLTNDL